MTVSPLNYILLRARSYILEHCILLHAQSVVSSQSPIWISFVSCHQNGWSSSLVICLLSSEHESLVIRIHQLNLNLISLLSSERDKGDIALGVSFHQPNYSQTTAYCTLTLSFHLNPQSQCHLSLFIRTWQKRPRELDHPFRFENEKWPFKCNRLSRIASALISSY